MSNQDKNSDEDGQRLNQSFDKKDFSRIEQSPERHKGAVISTQAEDEITANSEVGTDSSIAGNRMVNWIYALGRIEVRFPNLGIEKELAQVTSRSETAGLTDRQLLHEVLSKPENRYLANQLCWVFTVEGLETYILQPRHSADLYLLIDAVRPAPRTTDVDVVIGVRGPIAPPALCNGLMVPFVAYDQIYSFNIDALINSIPRPKDISAKQFGPTAEELFQRIMQMADNAGATDDHRALNYLAVRYPAIYTTAVDAFSKKRSLTSVGVRTSRLSGTRRIVDVIFTFTHRETDVIERYFVRVDVTDEFPFLVTKISPYYIYDQYP